MLVAVVAVVTIIVELELLKVALVALVVVAEVVMVLLAPLLRRWLELQIRVVAAVALDLLVITVVEDLELLF
jgi:hypothetical protein